MASRKHGLMELAIFLTINLGISLLWRTGQAVWPHGILQTLPMFLIVVGSILALNQYRSFAVRSWRMAYATIAILNVLTTVGTGNSGFLTSLGTLYRLATSFI